MKVREYWDSFKDTINEGSRKVRKAYKTNKAKRSAKKKINKALDVLTREINRIDKKDSYTA